MGGGDTSVPVKANLTAATISFTISEQVTATQSAEDPVNLTYSDLLIKNTMKAGKLQVTSLVAEGQNGWSVVKDSSVSDWKALAFDQKKLSILADNGDITKADLAESLTTSVSIPNAGETTYKLTGHTGPVSTAVTNETVAKIVATISLSKEDNSGSNFVPGKVV